MHCTHTYDDIGDCQNTAVHPRGVKGIHPHPLCSRCLQAVKKPHLCQEEGCAALAFRQGRCRPHQYRPLRRLEPWQLREVREQLANHVQPDWQTGCWVYAYWTDDDYGRINARHGIGIWLAHMLSYGLFFEGYPNGRELDHLCNRPLCASPFHLRPATPNANDKLRQLRIENPEFPWWTDKSGKEIDPPAWPLSLIVFSQLHSLPMGQPGAPLFQAQEDAAHA